MQQEQSMLSAQEQQVRGRFDSYRRKIFRDNVTMNTILVSADSARYNARRNAEDALRKQSGDSTAELPDDWESTEEGVRAIRAEEERMEKEIAINVHRDATGDAMAELYNIECKRRFIMVPELVYNPEFGCDTQAIDQNGNPLFSSMQIEAPQPDSDYYAEVWYTAADNTPNGLRVARLLTEIQAAENDQIQRLYVHRTTPGQSIAEVLLDDSRLRGPVPLPRDAPGMREMDAVLIPPQAENILSMDGNYWANLPPNDPRWQAYMAGLDGRAGLSVMLAAQKGAQPKIDAFTANVARQLENLVSGGEITTPEQAEQCFKDVVNAAIRNNTLFSKPSLSQNGEHVIFADDDSWMRFVANLTTKVLLPIQKNMATPKKATQPRKRVRGYATEEAAIKAGQRTITDWYAPAGGSKTDSASKIREIREQRRSYMNTAAHSDTHSVHLEESFYTSPETQAPSPSVQFEDSFCTPPETPIPPPPERQPRRPRSTAPSLDDTANVIPRRFRTAWRPASTPGGYGSGQRTQPAPQEQQQHETDFSDNEFMMSGFDSIIGSPTSSQRQ